MKPWLKKTFFEILLNPDGETVATCLIGGFGLMFCAISSLSEGTGALVADRFIWSYFVPFVAFASAAYGVWGLGKLMSAPADPKE